MPDSTPPLKLHERPRPGSKPLWIGALVLLAVLAVPGYGIFNWFFCRIEVPPEHFAVLIAKTGDDLPSGEIIARKTSQKGIQLEVLLPGRHFRNPLFWDWYVHPQLTKFTTIPANHVGVLTRLYGDPPADLKESLLVDANSGEKGIVARVKMPGQYPINPYAYRVTIFKATEIPAGFVGVVCNQVGKQAVDGNAYLVGEGERGVRDAVLGQGSHYLNPYAKVVYLVDLRSQRLEFSEGDGGPDKEGRRKSLSAVRFPSSDGFDIEVHLTVEWSIARDRAPEVFVRIGTGDPETLLEEILYKTLIPALRGQARIEGSKYPATNYISGESRTKFQDAIFDSLSITSLKQGIQIHSVLVNDIVPPDEIAAPIRGRQVAKEELMRNKVQAIQAKAEQRLARQEVRVEQKSLEVLAETEKKKREIEADNERAVALIEQEQLLTVAKAELAAAKLEAEAILSRGKAEATVIIAQNEAAAEGLKASVSAFRSPGSFASYTFAQRLAPGMRTVFASPDGPFGDLFKDLLPPGKTKMGGGR